jgi:hypothetical protein
MAGEKHACKKIEQKVRCVRLRFLIICGGEKTEPNYFRCFSGKTDKFVCEVKVEVEKKSPYYVVKTAIEHKKKSWLPYITIGYGLF